MLKENWFLHLRRSTSYFQQNNAQGLLMRSKIWHRFLMLAYLVAWCTRPDLVQAVSKYMSNSGRSHWNVFKWILRYLRRTSGYGLMFRGKECGSVIGFVDSYYGGDLDNRRSTTWYIVTLTRAHKCWRSVQQPIIAMSTT